MNILVCISNVPDTTSKINFIDNDSKFDKNGVSNHFYIYDDFKNTMFDKDPYKMMMESVDMVESIPVSSSDGYGSTDVDANEFYSNNGRKSNPETLENDLVVLRERLANLECQITNIMNDDEGEEE